MIKDKFNELFIASKNDTIYDFELLDFSKNVVLKHKEAIPRLFRYSSADYYNIRALETQSLYLSPSGNMNDVFEGLSCEINDKVIEGIEEIRDIAFLKSFSEEKSSLLMWAYYADNHSGFVIEYEPKSTRFDFCYNCSRYNPEKCKQRAVRGLLYPIIYQNERTDATMWLDAKLGELILKYTGLSDKVYNPDILFYDRICLTKDEKWAHEKEWRVVCYPERQCEVGKPIEMTTPTPKAIYYGVNILPENLSMLRSVVQALSSISPTPIKEYQMKINNFAKGFELTAELLQQ